MRRPPLLFLAGLITLLTWLLASTAGGVLFMLYILILEVNK